MIERVWNEISIFTNLFDITAIPLHSINIVTSKGENRQSSLILKIEYIDINDTLTFSTSTW